MKLLSKFLQARVLFGMNTLNQMRITMNTILRSYNQYNHYIALRRYYKLIKWLKHKRFISKDLYQQAIERDLIKVFSDDFIIDKCCFLMQCKGSSNHETQKYEI